MKKERKEPGPGEESVWDYPRPPKVEPTSKQVHVKFNNVIIAYSNRAQRVLETSHPPVFYIPPEDVAMEYLRISKRATFCEWKGLATYFTIKVDDRTADDAAWTYEEPNLGFLAIKDHIAFYPSKMDACFVDGEHVKAQKGDFYGGWITKDIVGPFKGEPGTLGW